MYKTLTIKDIKLPDGTETNNYSKDYMVYCEALNLSKKNLAFRQTFLKKIDRPHQQERVNKLKYWLTFIWNKK
jgi:hypothetical protein